MGVGVDLTSPFSGAVGGHSSGSKRISLSSSPNSAELGGYCPHFPDRATAALVAPGYWEQQ
jgi:hypothetical protein